MADGARQPTKRLLHRLGVTTAGGLHNAILIFGQLGIITPLFACTHDGRHNLTHQELHTCRAQVVFLVLAHQRLNLCTGLAFIAAAHSQMQLILRFNRIAYCRVAGLYLQVAVEYRSGILRALLILVDTAYLAVSFIYSIKTGVPTAYGNVIAKLKMLGQKAAAVFITPQNAFKHLRVFLLGPDNVKLHAAFTETKVLKAAARKVLSGYILEYEPLHLIYFVRVLLVRKILFLQAVGQKIILLCPVDREAEIFQLVCIGLVCRICVRYHRVKLLTQHRGALLFNEIGAFDIILHKLLYAAVDIGEGVCQIFLRVSRIATVQHLHDVAQLQITLGCAVGNYCHRQQQVDDDNNSQKLLYINDFRCKSLFLQNNCNVPVFVGGRNNGDVFLFARCMCCFVKLTASTAFNKLCDSIFRCFREFMVSNQHTVVTVIDAQFIVIQPIRCLEQILQIDDHNRHCLIGVSACDVQRTHQNQIVFAIPVLYNRLKYPRCH